MSGRQRLPDLPGRAGGREGLVFRVREEGLTFISIYRVNGDRENPTRKRNWQ